MAGRARARDRPRHSIPAGVPFAAAPTAHWPNALVLAELIFDGLERAFGDRGLMLAQLLAVARRAGVLARDAGAGGADPIGTGAALLIAAVGALPSLAIVAGAAVLAGPVPGPGGCCCAPRRRSPSRAIWLAVPLLALWSNLHGAALLGLGLRVRLSGCSSAAAASRCWRSPSPPPARSRCA